MKKILYLVYRHCCRTELYYKQRHTKPLLLFQCHLIFTYCSLITELNLDLTVIIYWWAKTNGLLNSCYQPLKKYEWSSLMLFSSTSLQTFVHWWSTASSEKVLHVENFKISCQPDLRWQQLASPSIGQDGLEIKYSKPVSIKENLLY